MKYHFVITAGITFVMNVFATSRLTWGVLAVQGATLTLRQVYGIAR